MDTLMLMLPWQPCSRIKQNKRTTNTKYIFIFLKVLGTWYELIITYSNDFLAPRNFDRM